MSDDRMNLEIGVDVNVTDLDQLKALRHEYEKMSREILQFAREIKAAADPLSSLGRVRAQLTGSATRGSNAALDAERNTFADLKRRLAFERRMAAQKSREESSAAKRTREEQAETRRALNDQLNFSLRMVRERGRADAEAERESRRQVAETAKVRDRANRKAISDARELERVHARAAERAARGAGQVRSGVGRVAGTAAATGAVVGYGTERMIERGISSRMEADTEETKLKIFADTDDGRGGRRAITDADIRKLRRGSDGLDNLAVRTGTSVPEALRAYTEAAKAGLLDPARQARNILTATNGLELDPTRTTKLLGTLARNMGPLGTPDRLYRTLNAVAVGAREDPTQSDEIIEGLNRSQGLLAMSKGFTPEDLVAMVSGGQSVGIQPGKAGTAIMALGSSILQGGNKFLDPKKRKELNFAARKLGFGSAKDLSGQFAGENGKSVYYQVLKRLQAMEPQLRQQVTDALGGSQWSDEILQVVNGVDGQIATDRQIHDPKNAGFLDEANNKKMNSWQGLWNQSKTIFSLFWESFGAGFDGILRDINAFVLDLHGKLNYDRISGYVREGLDGLKAGLGYDTWKQALESLVPGNVGDLGKKIGGFAKGFSSAIRDIAGAVSSVARMFGGGGGAESIGRLTAQFFSLGAAALVLAPVMGVLGGLASIVLGIANAARAAAGVLGLGAGAAAGGGAVAGALGAIARILSGGFIVGLAATIGSMRGEISTLILDAVRPLVTAIWDGLKSAFSLEGLKSGGRALLNELIPAPLQRWLDSGSPDPNAEGSRWVDPPSRDNTVPRKLTEAVQANTDALRAQTKAGAGAATPPAAPGEKPTITYDQWRAQFAGLKGAELGRALEAQRDRSGGPAWGPQTGNQINHGLRGHIGRLRGTGDGDRAGGSRAWRNRNPGNLKDGPFARRLGATGRDKDGFAVFPDEATGRKAQESLLFESSSYRNLSIRDAINRYAPGSDGNNPASYAQIVARAAGVGVDTPMSALTPDQRKRFLDAQRDHEGWTPGRVASGGSSGGSTGAPGTTDGRSVPRMTGNLSMDGNNYQFGSGGHNGANSIPAGTYPLTPGTIGPWGQRHGALGINNNRIWDAQLGRFRDGIELHSASSARMLSAGCLAINREQWAEFRSRALDFYRRNGNRAWLKVDSNGNASITADRPDDPAKKVAADANRTRELGQNATKPNLGNLDVAGSNAVQPPSVSSQVPIRPQAASGGAQSGGGGQPIHAPITINGAGSNPEELAAKVQKHLQDSMNRRTHDYDGFA